MAGEDGVGDDHDRSDAGGGDDGGPVLVVGGTGRVGAAVARLLSERGHAVRVAGRAAEVRVDHDDPASYAPALVGVSTVFAALPDRPDAAAVEARLHAAAAEAGVGKVVKLSAASAGWRPPASFGVAHRQGEQTLASSPMRWTILRPTVFQETIAIFGQDAVRGRLVVPRCRDRVAFVSVDDIAEVAVEALTRADLDGATLELTGPEALSFDDVAAALGRTLGRRVRHVAVPRPIARRVLPLVAGLSRWEAGQVVDLFAGLDAGRQRRVTDDVSMVLGRPASPLGDRLGALVGAS
ncbi:MAG: NAD(P)H-binding protein [Actinomycetota bacterium]